MKRHFSLLPTLSLALIIILLPFFTLLFSQTFYHYEFNNLRVYDGENNQKIDESLSSLLSFFLYQNDVILSYNENEISHMKDVRNIFGVLEFLLFIAIVMLILCLLKFSKKSLKQILKYSSIISLLFLLILVLLSINFEQTFAIFHPIFFPQGNYTFNPEESFMKFMFPDEFFSDFLMVSLSISFIVSISLIISSVFYSKKRRDKLINSN